MRRRSRRLKPIRFFKNGKGTLLALDQVTPILRIAKLKSYLPTLGKGVAVKPSTLIGAGRGLFTERPFVRGELVTYYDGAIIDATKTNPEQLDPSLRSHTKALFFLRYAIVGNAPGYCEGADGEGGGAYINDARDKARWNCSFEQVDSDVVRQHPDSPFERIIAIRALRDIEAGEELFIDYGSVYWRLAGESSTPSDGGFVQPVFLGK